MNGHILVFRGSLQNQGNVWALEFGEEIFLMGAGKDNPLVTKEFVNVDYLREKKNNIKCIFLVNSSPKNSAFLSEIYSDLQLENVPIYGSKMTKIGLDNFLLDKEVLENFVSISKNQEDVKISSSVNASFISTDTYYIGTLGIRIYNKDYCVYYFEDFAFSVLNNSNILFDPLFFMQKLRNFFSLRRRRTCLVSGFQNLSLSNNGSLTFEFRKFFNKEKKQFLFFYDFDFLHIMETFEIAQKLNLKVSVADKLMFNFLTEIFQNSSFSKIIKSWDERRESSIYILTVNFSENMSDKVSKFLEKKKKPVFCFFSFPNEWRRK